MLVILQYMNGKQKQLNSSIGSQARKQKGKDPIDNLSNPEERVIALFARAIALELRGRLKQSGHKPKLN